MDMKTAQAALEPQSGLHPNEARRLNEDGPVATPAQELPPKYKAPDEGRVGALALALGLDKEKLDVVLLALVDDSMPDSMFDAALAELAPASADPFAEQDEDVEEDPDDPTA